MLIVDMQERILMDIPHAQELIDKVALAIDLAKELSMPVIAVVQRPEVLGTLPEKIALRAPEIVEKETFSAWRCKDIRQILDQHDKATWLVAGLEAHICVWQTVSDMKEAGLEPIVLTDAVASVTLGDFSCALTAMQAEKIALKSVEMCLFEILGSYTHEKFRACVKKVKQSRQPRQLSMEEFQASCCRTVEVD